MKSRQIKVSEAINQYPDPDQEKKTWVVFKKNGIECCEDANYPKEVKPNDDIIVFER